MDLVDIPEGGRAVKVVIGLLYRYYMIVSNDDSSKATKKSMTTTPDTSHQGLDYEHDEDDAATKSVRRGPGTGKSKSKPSTKEKTSTASGKKKTCIFEKLMTTSRAIIKKNLDAHLKSLLHNNVSTLGGTCMLERNHALLAKRKGFDLALTSTVLYPFASQNTSFGQYLKWLDSDKRFIKKPNEFFRIQLQTEIDSEDNNDEETNLSCQFLDNTGPLEYLLNEFWSSARSIDLVYLKALRDLYEILFSRHDGFESWSKVSENELMGFFAESASSVLFERNDKYDEHASVETNAQISYKYSLAAALGDTTQENTVAGVLQDFGMVWNEGLMIVVCNSQPICTHAYYINNV